MISAKQVLFNSIKILLIVYLLICIVLFLFQEKLIFFPDKLPDNYRFSFNRDFEEINLKTEEGELLNGVLFKTDSSKGIIFYLHGNAGSVQSWGEVAKRYTDLHYNVFILDYPGYGKSSGKIKSQSQLFKAVQLAYDSIRIRFGEDKIIVLGYSIGTGPASWLASMNHPKRLILQAPYYSLTDMMRNTYPIIPTCILKYKFETNKYLHSCTMPITIFHGDSDEVIYYGSSLKLQKEMKESDSMITLKGQGHNGITDNPEYIAAITSILE